MNPAAYARENKQWPCWLGKEGVVLAVTTVSVSSPDLANHTPYQYALVEFGEERHEFLVVPESQVQSGERVQCVLRRQKEGEPHQIIAYTVKVQPVHK